MSIQPETLMAYVDGELDAIGARRVERAIADDPALARDVERQRALKARIGARFDRISDEPVPDRLAAMVQSNVIALPPRAAPRRWSGAWQQALALAACLVLGVMVGRGWSTGPVTVGGSSLYASSNLGRALDAQLASTAGDIAIPVSFRDKRGAYCRVFSSQAVDGIACHDGRGWALRQTRPGTRRTTGDYRQAGSAGGDLMAAAQDMMAGEPLDAASEAQAKASGWR